MNIQEFMTTNIKLVEADNTVYDAIEKMVDKRIRSLVVRFSEKESDYGIITARDVVFRVLAKGLDPQKTKVSEIATRPLVCVSSNMELLEAAKMMEESGVARIFVCEGPKIVGVVSMIDLMAAALIMKARGEYVFA
jgi:signal-transduction protein with cAMP-binding, CBS, and nucleotidyltransferase domain